MVIIILKLQENEYNIIWDKSTFTLLDIYMNLVEKGITLQQLDCIEFKYNDSIITNHVVDYDIDADAPPIIIWLLINDDIIKQDYIKYTQSIEDTIPEDTIPENTIQEDTIPEDTIKDINLKTLELFQEPDFKELLRIVITKPHLLNKVSSYIANGDISSEIEISYDIVDYNTEYLQIIELLNSIEIDYDKHNIMIKSTIKHFNGHINLSLRYILANIDKFK